jgi:hypothetical protein
VSSTKLLLVLSDWGSLEQLLTQQSESLYAIKLYTLWCYARLHGYGLEIYVHGEPLGLPHAMPVAFVNVLGVRYLFSALGYQHVLYLDMNMFASPHSAPALSLFSKAGSFLQPVSCCRADDTMHVAPLLWRNNPDAAALLQAWWDVGVAGCCPAFKGVPFEQIALQHLLLAYAIRR